MKILFVNPFYKPYLGGIERVIEKLGVEFLKAGYQVAVLTTKYSFPYEYHFDWGTLRLGSGQVRVYRLNSWPKNPPRFYQAPLVWFSPLEIRRIVTSLRPDVVVYMGDKWFWGNFWTRLFTSKARHIWSVVWHDLSWKKFWLRVINFVFGKLVGEVIVASNLEKTKVIKAYGISESLVKVVPWGVDKVEVTKSEDAQDCLQILCVGRLSKHKGQKWLVERFIAAAKEFKQPVKLLLIGKAEDNTYNEINDLVKDRSDVEVILTASDEELARIYGASDVFAMFPEYESFGLVFLEAQSYGLPILTHQVGAIREVLGESVVIVAPYDSIAATGELVKLVNDVEYRNRYKALSATHFKEALTWNECARRFIEN